MHRLPGSQRIASQQEGGQQNCPMALSSSTKTERDTGRLNITAGSTGSTGKKHHDIQHAKSVNLRRAYSQSCTFTARLQTPAQWNRGEGGDIFYPVISLSSLTCNDLIAYKDKSYWSRSLRITLPPLLTRSLLCGYL